MNLQICDRCHDVLKAGAVDRNQWVKLMRLGVDEVPGGPDKVVHICPTCKVDLIAFLDNDLPVNPIPMKDIDDKLGA